MSDTITQLPSAPLPTDTTAQFNEKAFNLVAALDTFVDETNILAASVEADAATAESAASTATTKANEALASKNDSEAAKNSALTYKTAAENAAVSAASSYDAFDDRYLGAKSADPTTDNDGNALIEGAEYWNTTAKQRRTWDGAQWVATFLPEGDYLTKNEANQTYASLSGADFKGSIREAKVALVANDIDCSAGNYFTKTFTAGAVSLTMSNIPASGTTAAGIVETINAGLATITYPTGSKWAGGTAPTLTSSGKDVLGWYVNDGGTTINWFVIGKDVK